MSLSSLDHMSVMTLLVILYALPYLLSIYVLIKSYSFSVAEYYRNNRAINPTLIYELSIYVWVRNLLIAFSVYWTLSVVFFFYRDFTEYLSIIPAFSSVMIYILGFLGLRNPGVFCSPEISNIEHDTDGGKR